MNYYYKLLNTQLIHACSVAHGTYSVSQGVIYIRFTCFFLWKYSRCLINSILGKFKIALITCIDCEDTCQVTSFFLIKQSPVLSFQLNQADLHLKVNKGSGGWKRTLCRGLHLQSHKQLYPRAGDALRGRWKRGVLASRECQDKLQPPSIFFCPFIPLQN